MNLWSKNQEKIFFENLKISHFMNNYFIRQMMGGISHIGQKDILVQNQHYKQETL